MAVKEVSIVEDKIKVTLGAETLPPEKFIF